MNYIDFLFVAIILLMTFIGYRNGFFYSVLSFARAFVGVPLSVFVSNRYAGVVYENYVREYALNSISNQLNESLNMDSAVGSITDLIQSLPQFLTESADLTFLNEITAQNAAEKAVDAVVQPLAVALIKTLLFVLSIVLFYVATGLVIRFVKRLSKKRKKGVVGRANRFLGAVFGLLKSLVAVFILCAVISLVLNFAGAESGGFFKALSESAVAEFVNQYNWYTFL